MSKRLKLFIWTGSLLFLFAACQRTVTEEAMVAIQIQDRNGLTETISNPDRLIAYESANFFSSQPYKKVLRVYKSEGKNYAKITTYHANGMVWQYLEAQEMRAHGAYREWFPNGQLKIEATVIGGTADVSPGSQNDWQFDGISQVWDEQGNLIAKISYDKGSLEGSSLYYFPNSQIEKEIPYVKNVIEGTVTEFYEGGQIKSKGEYHKGCKQGESLFFFEEGQLARIEEFREGLLLKGIYYNPQREVIAKVDNGGGFQAIYEKGALTLIEFRMGKPDGIVKKFTASGELHKSYFLKNGRKQGEEIEYYLSSEIDPSLTTSKPLPKLSLNWSENMIQGTVKTWYPNGSLQSERQYCRNKKQGPALAWYREGSLMLVEEYEADRLIQGEYFKINRKEAVSKILNGNGIAFLYDERGTFLRKVAYAKGKPVDLEE